MLFRSGKLGKLANNTSFHDWRMLFCLRLAQVLCRGRSDEDLPRVRVSERDGVYQVCISKEWAVTHPLTEFSLLKEAAEWVRIGRPYELSLK